MEARTGIEPMSTDLQKLAHYITNCISYKKYRCAIECAIQIGDFSKDSYIRSMEVWLLPELNNNLKWCPVFIDHYTFPSY